jgi:hypothetical protein
VLARIEGAPAGTKGISLFIVPKIWVNEDGTMAEPNDVVCTGIEKKLGLHASPTCQLSFGSKGNCRGLLLGEENRGMQVMFHMMNEARLGVGALGLFNASCAYLYALDYVRQRLQCRDIEEAPQVSIIRHPDVRRMLMWMKTHTEGLRSFVYYVAYLFDRIECTQNDEERQGWQDLVDLLTPVIKSYCTDRGFDATVQAMPFLDAMGDTIMAWMLLWRASVAAPKLDEITKGAEGDAREEKIKKNKNAAFYQGQIQSAAYFIESILPITEGRIKALQKNCRAVTDIPESSFGG